MPQQSVNNYILRDLCNYINNRYHTCDLFERYLVSGTGI